MGVPNFNIQYDPALTMDVSETNIDAGNHDSVLEYHAINLAKGFSIVTGTISNVDAKIYASNKDGIEVDITSELCGGDATFQSDRAYLIDIISPVKRYVVRLTRTNAVNSVAFTLYAPRR